MELLQKLTRGDVAQAEVRLIEGWTFSQFRAALDASPDLRHDTSGLEDTEVLTRIQAADSHPEGLFFPDTYLFARGSSDLAVLRRAYRAMQRHLRTEWDARAPNVPYGSAYEALIMASIIEKETGQAGERDQVGGVLGHPLRIRMRPPGHPPGVYRPGTTLAGNPKKKHLLTHGPPNTPTRGGLPPPPP